MTQRSKLMNTTLNRLEGMEALAADLGPYREYYAGRLAMRNQAERLRTQAATTTVPRYERPAASRFLRYGCETTYRDLPYLTYPITTFIADKKPDVVLAADRGARYIGLGVFASWHVLYPDQPFPTTDGKLHFGRISTHVYEEAYREILDSVLKRSGVSSALHERPNADEAKPVSVLFIDDWSLWGKNVPRLQENLSDMISEAGGEPTIYTAKLTGPEDAADVVCHPKSCGAVWSDKGREIGVNYNIVVGWGAQPIVVGSEQASTARMQLQQSFIAAYGLPSSVGYEPVQGSLVAV